MHIRIMYVGFPIESATGKALLVKNSLVLLSHIFYYIYIIFFYFKKPKVLYYDFATSDVIKIKVMKTRRE